MAILERLLPEPAVEPDGPAPAAEDEGLRELVRRLTEPVREERPRPEARPADRREPFGYD
jgi:hypothetical protein